MNKAQIKEIKKLASKVRDHDLCYVLNNCDLYESASQIEDDLRAILDKQDYRKVVAVFLYNVPLPDHIKLGD